MSDTAIMPELIDTEQLCTILNLHRSTLSRWMAAGRVPAPLPLGKPNRWRRDEIIGWIEAGCPDRVRWAAIKEHESRRKGRR